MVSTRASHLHSQGLWLPEKNESILNICKRLSYIQIDAIFSVARSQDIVLHSRSKGYKELSIWQYLKSGKLFEGYAHAKCLIPIEHLPYYHSARVDRRNHSTWWQEYLDKHPYWPEQVIEQIKSEGLTRVSDITVPSDFPKSTGWNSPGKRILDYLETRGYIYGRHDEKFKIHYDLTENVVGDDIAYYDPQERFWFHLRNTLKANGLTPLHRLLHYSYNHRTLLVNGKKVSPRKIINNADEHGIQSRMIDGELYYHLDDYELDDIPELQSDEYSVFLLSPFDNALWSREALLQQYQFDYKMEIYVPQKKRKYGYYVMPILYGPDFVGRVEVKFDRQSSTMKFIRWYWEKKVDTEFLQKLKKKCIELSTFHGAKNIDYGDLKY